MVKKPRCASPAPLSQPVRSRTTLVAGGISTIFFHYKFICMKTTLVFGITWLARCGWLFAQNADPSVVAAGGGTATGGQVQLEWTLGEAAAVSASTPKLLLTEGFHQPSLEVEPVVAAPSGPATLPDIQPVGPNSPPVFSATIFPNPVASQLSVRFDGAGKFDGARVEMLSAGGKTLLDQLLPAGEPQAVLQLADLPPGIYFLRCQSLDGLASQTFKVTKF